MTCTWIHRIVVVVSECKEEDALIPTVLPVRNICKKDFNESLVKFFLTPIGLWVICRRQLDLGDQKEEELTSKLTSKLRTVITQQDVWHVLECPAV